MVAGSAIGSVMMMATASLQPRAAIVTGGTRGIGRGIAEAFAAEGTSLVLTYVSDQEAARATRAHLRDTYGVDVVCVRGDLVDPRVRAMVFRVFDAQFGDRCALRAMVHNAGQYVGVTSANDRGIGAQSASFGAGTVDAAAFDAMRYYQSLYGEAFVDLCEMALQRMDGGGSLIGISSPGCTMQYNPMPGYELPGSGKCVMEFASRLFALRAAAKRVNCNVIVPGITRTDAWTKVAASMGKEGEALVTALASDVAPMGPMGPRDVGDAVAFLCSAQGRWITGVSLPVDGGVHLRC